MDPSQNIKIIFPDSFPPFRHFSVDDEDRIYVHTYLKNDRGQDIFEVFDKDGRFLGRTGLPTSPSLIKKNRMYSVENDAEGFQIIKVYEIKWNI